ncbi:MAG: GNAT family N-acetyltransferase [Anaerolineaceae bacterium]
MTQTNQSTGARERLEVEVRKVTAADATRLTAVLARSFDDDPVANWFVAQDKSRARRIYDFMDVSLTKMTLPHGECYTTPDLQGGALWTPPGKWKLGMLQQLMLIPAMVKSTTWKRIPKVMSGISALEKRHPHEPHYYLMVLGTEPNLQGRGIGGQLMAPVLARCDQERVPAYLESSKEKNLPLYERNGFKVTEEFLIPDGGPKLWLMWRDPK